MSVAVVVELSHELQRLAVAGVGLAKGDHRIAALLPALETSGEKVAVFARIAERTSALLAASKATAPRDFLQLNTLVGAVLRAQCRSDVDGEFEPSAPGTTSARRIPARFLTDLPDLLHMGRSDALLDAIERDWFGDVRLARFALDALHADNAELANLAATMLIPPYGKGVVPLLVDALELSSRRPAARTIETVYRTDAASGAALARQILDPAAARTFDLRTEGVDVSDEASAAALGCLGDGEADRLVLAEYLDARKKTLRVAALSRLLALGDADADARVVAMLGGSAAKSREAIESIPALTSAAASALVVARAHALGAALDAEKPATADANDAVRVLALLARSGHEPARFDAALALFERFDILRGKASELRESTVNALIGYLLDGCPASRRKALVCRVLPIAPGYAMLAAIRRFGPVEALPLLEAAGRRAFRDGLRHVFSGDSDTVPYHAHDLPPPSEWNEAWLDVGLRLELVELVGYLLALDPGRVVEHVLSRRGACRPELAITVLAADPGCAAALRPRLDKGGEDSALFDALCKAIVAGDRTCALELVAAVPRRYGRERLAALRERLTDRLPEGSE